VTPRKSNRRPFSAKNLPSVLTRPVKPLGYASTDLLTWDSLSSPPTGAWFLGARLVEPDVKGVFRSRNQSVCEIFFSYLVFVGFFLEAAAFWEKARTGSFL
jgi:hypothetical protein